jgi:hypothetical protein
LATGAFDAIKEEIVAAALASASAPFFLAVLAKTGCKTWFFAGEFVVDCW